VVLHCAHILHILYVRWSWKVCNCMLFCHRIASKAVGTHTNSCTNKLVSVALCTYQVHWKICSFFCADIILFFVKLVYILVSWNTYLVRCSHFWRTLPYVLIVLGYCVTRSNFWQSIITSGTEYCLSCVKKSVSSLSSVINKRVGWDGFDLLNIKMMMLTGSSSVCLRWSMELHRQNIWGRLVGKCQGWYDEFWPVPGGYADPEQV